MPASGKFPSSLPRSRILSRNLSRNPYYLPALRQSAHCFTSLCLCCSTCSLSRASTPGSTFHTPRNSFSSHALTSRYLFPSPNLPRHCLLFFSAFASLAFIHHLLRLSFGCRPVLSRPSICKTMSLHEKTQAQFVHDRLSTEPESMVKAAAWLWYLHGKSSCREGGYVNQPQTRERKESRFKSEARTKYLPFRPAIAEDFWDCDSELYDSFELLSFSDRLNRSLTENPKISAPAAFTRPPPPPPPRSSGDFIGNSVEPSEEFSVSPQFSLSSGQSIHCSDAERGENGISDQEKSKWSIGGFLKALKKVTSTIRKRTRHRTSHELERYQQQQLSPYHHRQSRPHYPIYSYLHRCYKAGDDFLACIEAGGTITARNKAENIVPIL